MAKKTYVPKYTPMTYDPRTGFSKKTSSSSSGVSKTQSQSNNLDTRLKTVGMDTDTRNPVEKFLNLTPNQNVVFDIFELLDRPGQAIRNVLAPNQSDTSNLLENAWQGFTGQEKTSGQDLVNRLIGKPAENASNLEKFGSGLLGFGAELITDPLNWVGVGLADDVVKIGGKTAKLVNNADELADLTKAGKNIIDVSENASNLKKALQGVEYVKNADGVYKIVDKFKDANKLVTGFNKGQDLAFYGLGKALGKGTGVVGDVARKVAPEFIEDLGVVTNDIKRMFSGAYKTLADVGGEKVSSYLKKIKGISNEDYKIIQQTATNIAKDYKNVIDNVMTNQGVLDDLLDYARKDMPELFESIVKKGSQMYVEDVKKVMDNILTGTLSNESKFTYTGLLDTLANSGKVRIGTQGGTSNEVLKKFTQMLDTLGLEGDYELGGALKNDLRSISLGENAIETLRNFLKDTDGLPGGLTSYFKNNGLDVNLDEVFTAKGTSIDSLLTGPNAQEILNLVKPIADSENRVLQQIRDTLLKMGYDVDVIENYVPLRLTGEKLDAMQLSTRKYMDDIGKEVPRVKEGRLKTYVPQGSTAPVRSSFGNPVEMNRLNRELLGDNAPLFRTDLMEVVGEVAQSQFKIAEQQTVLKEVLETFTRSMERGLDNGTILTTDPKKVFTGVETALRDSRVLNNTIKKSLQQNSDELADWLMKTVQTNDVSIDNIRNAIGRSVSLGNEIPPNIQKIASNIAKLDNSITPTMIEEATGILNKLNIPTEGLDPKSIMDKYKNFASDPYAVSKYLKDSNLTVGMKKYSSIDDLFRNLNYTEKFGVDRSELRGLKDSLKEMLGTGEVYINKNIAGMIERAQTSERSVQRIMDDLNKYMNKWKSAKLYSAGFPLRNLFGDSTNLYVGGMPASKIVSGASKAMADIKGLEGVRNMIAKNLQNGLDELANLTPKQTQLWQEWTQFIETGINAQTRTSNEFMDVIKSITGSTNPQDALSIIRNSPELKKIAEMSLNTSQFFDTANRFSAWRWANSEDGIKTIRDLGFTSADDFVRATLIDYDDISKFENDYMRKIFPFYTFMRKNTEYHVRNFSKNARKYGQIADFAKNMYQAQGIDDRDLPSYIKESLQIPVGTTEDGKIKYLKLTPSFMEAYQTLTGKNLISGLNPMLKTPAELVTGTDFFTGQPKDTSLRSIVTNDLVGSLAPIPQAFSPLAQTLAGHGVDMITQPNVKGGDIGKEILDALAKGTVGGATGGPLTGITDPEVNRYYNDQAQLEELNKLKKQYKKITGQNLPTIDELREMGLLE